MSVQVQVYQVRWCCITSIIIIIFAKLVSFCATLDIITLYYGAAGQQSVVAVAVISACHNLPIPACQASSCFRFAPWSTRDVRQQNSLRGRGTEGWTTVITSRTCTTYIEKWRDAHTFLDVPICGLSYRARCY